MPPPILSRALPHRSTTNLRDGIGRLLQAPFVEIGEHHIGPVLSQRQRHGSAHALSCGPEMRTMPTAPRPGAVAMAMMGSWWRDNMAVQFCFSMQQGRMRGPVVDGLTQHGLS